MNDAKNLHEETLAQLAAGNPVQPREAVKARMMTLIEAIDTAADQGAPEVDPLGPVRAELEAILAVALPLVEHGGVAGERSLVASLQALADRASDSEAPITARLAAAALHNLSLAITAYALAHDQPETVVAIAGVQLYDRQTTCSVFEAAAIRQPEALGGTRHAFDNLLDWLRDSALRTCFPLLHRDRGLEAALAEAELIAGLRCAVRREDRPHCASKGKGAGESRLRDRAQTPNGISALTKLYSASICDLRVRLNRLYQQLKPGGLWAERRVLFPDASARD